MAAAAALALLAACAGKPPPPPPPPAPAPVAAPVPVAEPPPVREAEDWRDLPATPGDWSYRSDDAGSEARFAGLTLRCDSGVRRIRLARDGAAGALQVRTSYGERSLPSGAALAAGDPLLDQIAFSRGRFTVEAPGLAMLVVPAWAEPGRVVEDCRG